MLIALASVKGSPGVTSAALALAATWPRPVVLLEADPAGGDLAYRCQAAHGGPVYSHKGLMTLAAAVRRGQHGPDSVLDHSQLLACGVNLVQGVGSATEARGLAGLWSSIAEACVTSEVDVLADLGRLGRDSATMPLAQAAQCVLPVAATSLESVMHLTQSLGEMVGALVATTIRPVLVGPDGHAASDCADLDEVLGRAQLPVHPSQPVPHDARALVRLEDGEKASSRLGRTLLLRSARTISSSIVEGGPVRPAIPSSEVVEPARSGEGPQGSAAGPLRGVMGR